MNKADHELLKGIKKGDVALFEALFKELYAPLCGYANKMLQNKEQAEELVQEIFYKFWMDRDKILIHTSVKSYFYKAVYNLCLKFIEHKNVVINYQNQVMAQQHESYKPEDAMQYSEMYKIYKDTLKRLPNRCRKVFQLSRNYNLKYYEIAEKLSISIKTVEAEMGKALKAFRQNLNQYHIID